MKLPISWIRFGFTWRGSPGVVIQQLTPGRKEPLTVAPRPGMPVAQVDDDSPAASAVRQGGVIVAYRGKPITSVAAHVGANTEA